MRPRASATAPSFSSSRSTRFTVAREVPAIAAMSSCVSGHDTVLVRRRQLHEASADARLRVDVVRLDDAVGRAAKLLGEKAEKHVLHARVLPLQQREVVAEDRAGLAGLERLDGGGAARVGKQQRELAEALSRPEDVDEHAVAERRQDPRAEATAHDEMQGVGGIVAVEDDLALRERPPPRDREQLDARPRAADRRAAASPCAGQSVTRPKPPEGSPCGGPFRSRRRAATLTA